MTEGRLTGVPNELARCLRDAQLCAEACESYLGVLPESEDVELQARANEMLATPAAVARVLIDVTDHPTELVLAAARLCRDATRDGAQAARSLPGAEAVVTAMETSAESCARLLDATSETH